MIKILFLQPKEYFDDLGIQLDLNHIVPKYGLNFTTNLRETLSGYSLVVNALDHDLEARYLIKTAHAYGVATLYLMDGIYEHFNSFLHPMFVKLNIKQLEHKFYSLVCTPTYEHCCLLKEKSIDSFFYIPKRVDFKKIIKSSNIDFLITTANTPYFNSHDFTSLLNLILKTYKAINSQSKSIKFRIFDVKLSEELEKHICDFNNVTEESIELAVASCKAVISTQSSIALGCLKNKIPLILLEHRGIGRGNLDVKNYITLNTTIENLLNVLDNIGSKSFEKIYHRYSYNSDNIGLVINESFVSSIKKPITMNKKSPWYFSLSYLYRKLYRHFNLKKYKKLILTLR